MIGEISNKSGEPKKFVQTFVLAQQPAGYFLLNDILRYINEGEEETAEGATEETAPTADVEMPQEPSAEAEPEKVEVEETQEESSAPLDAEVVDQKLEETTAALKDSASVSAVETPAESVQAVTEAPSKPEEAETVPTPEKAEAEIAAEEVKQPDVPKEPSPTPAPASAAAPAPARTPAPEPEKPKEPPKPMTWASRIAAAAGPVKPVVPLPSKAATAAAPAQPRPAAPAAAAAAPAAASAPAPSTETSAQSGSKETNEWRTAGADSKRQNRQSTAPQAEKEGTLAYVKFVTDKVKEDELRSALGSYGELVYFDINRSKVCFSQPTVFCEAANLN